ncbi:MAG: hypothetical protein K0Q68_81 [Moraxellaceae bacterium]|jgi:hypothetical protein|nr:hypothetical protein [Moraxellaceae bacterium]
MFISTYGYEQITEDGKRHHGLFHKAIDFANGIELFEIGTLMGVDRSFDGPVYCLKKDQARIPFIVQSASVISEMPMSAFNRKPLRYLNPAAAFPEVSVKLSSLGHDLKKIPLLREHIFYRNVWEEGDSHEHKFSENPELNSAFKAIQEALPVLMFEDYRSSINPKPSICRHVLPCATDKIYEPYRSGENEGKSVFLDAPEQPESPQAIINRIEERSQKSPISIEELMAEIISAERGYLFYGNLFASALMNNDKMLPILRASFEERYRSYHSCFEKFLLMVFGIFQSRQSSRAVYERYSWKIAP